MKKITVPFEVKQLTEDDGFFVFEGFASTFGNIDRGDDLIEFGAFSKTVSELMSSQKRSKLPVLWQHDQTMPIGGFTELRETQEGLFVKGRLPKSDTFVSGRVIPQMEVGSIGSMSIGYSALKSIARGAIRVLQEIKLWEISLVTVPMNPLAEVTGFKAAVPYQDLPLAPREREWDSDSAIMRVRQLLESTESPSESYRRAFLWFDETESGNFDSYKLPIADVIEGQLTAIPRAVFAAAAVMRGARGGVDIPEEDRDAVITHIDRYYDKMGLDSPFMERSCFRLDDMSVLNERELEKLLKSGVSFSNSNSKRLVSALKTFLRDGGEVRNREDSVGSEVLAELKALADFAKTLTSK